MERITSRSNPTVRFLRQLGADAGLRASEGLMLCRGRKLLGEALAAGLPVLCSGNCGFADLVEESGGMVIPPPFSQRTLNKALLRVLSTQETLEDMKQNAIGYGSHADFYHRAEVAAELIRGGV